MTLGFTGTSSGMTRRQYATVVYLFKELRLTELHHGDCIGADAEADRLAFHHGAAVIVHPPTDLRKRSFCDHLPNVLRSAKSYLARNRDIVAEGIDGLIAAPKDRIDKAGLRGQGTWTTIGYARQMGRRIWIVYPDGTFKEETAR